MHDVVTRPTRHTRHGRLLAVVGVFALFAAGLFSAAPASAATEVRNFSLSGTFTVPGDPTAPPPSVAPLVIPLPAGSTFSATVDTTTGAITNGISNIPTINSVQSTLAVATTISDATPSTGTLDLATGEINLTSSFKINIKIPAVATECNISPINVTPSTNGGGSPLTGSPSSATLVASGFSVPGVTIVDPTPCSTAIGGLVNKGLGAPTTATSLSLKISQVTTDVYVLHGLNLAGQTAAADRGTPVTVCKGTETLIADFQFGDVVGPVALPSGQTVKILVYGGANVNCATTKATPIISQDVTPEGAAVALVATAPPGPELVPELAAFPLAKACTKKGEGVLVAAHAASAPEVDVQVNAKSAGLLTYGKSLSATLPAAKYSVTVLLGATPIVGPADVPVTDANLTGVFVVGNLAILPVGGNTPAAIVLPKPSPVVPLFLNVKLATCEVPPPAAAKPAAATPAAATFTG